MAESTDAEIQAELRAAASQSSAKDFTTMTRKVTELPTPGTVLYSTDFETNNGGMTGNLDWEWGAYSWIGGNCYSTLAQPPSAHSGTNMWGTKLNTCYTDLGNNAGFDTCNNANKDDDSILSFTIDLTGKTDAQLLWWEWYDLFSGWDWAEVYVNGVVVFQHCYSSYAAPTSWVEQIVDLTPFVGGVATIEFHMMASTVVNKAGWYIDDIRVVTSSSSSIPALSEGGMIIFALLMAGVAIVILRKRRNVTA
ncbi:MAG TPA: IPTL-CTERM sorting domain-containing protein [Desulfobacteraceae bacterium]|nr:IPTL-CTERM sorting domain-containing protein [Desulfobacteraceae bacterium]HPQ29463.1 IPTL-CTERM sorting domain-containing protein [Desulfobacteraceae bacterium]